MLYGEGRKAWLPVQERGGRKAQPRHVWASQTTLADSRFRKG